MNVAVAYVLVASKGRPSAKRVVAEVFRWHRRRRR
jgi:hypothetical protein